MKLIQTINQSLIKEEKTESTLAEYSKHNFHHNYKDWEDSVSSKGCSKFEYQRAGKHFGDRKGHSLAYDKDGHIMGTFDHHYSHGIVMEGEFPNEVIINEQGDELHKSFIKWKARAQQIKPKVKVTGTVYKARAEGVGSWHGDHGFIYKHERKDEPEKEKTDESVVTELSKKTLSSYLKKSADDVSFHSFQAGSLDKDKDGAEKMGSDKKSFKRLAGINQAADKLAKEKAEKAKV